MNRKRLLIALLLLLVPAIIIIVGVLRDSEVVKDTGIVILVVYVAIGWKFGQDSKQIRN